MIKQQTDSLWASFIGSGSASLAYLLGGMDNLVIALAIFMACDYGTGLAAGFSSSTVNSKRGFIGFMKKGAMIIPVIVAHQLDIIAGSSDTHFMRNAMILFLIGVEGISLTENLGRLGVPVPRFLRSRFEQMKNENDKESV
jgi:toxin secretion/phage lysis holin